MNSKCILTSDEAEKYWSDLENKKTKATVEKAKEETLIRQEQCIRPTTSITGRRSGGNTNDVPSQANTSLPTKRTYIRLVQEESETQESTNSSDDNSVIESKRKIRKFIYLAGLGEFEEDGIVSCNGKEWKCGDKNLSRLLKKYRQMIIKQAEDEDLEDAENGLHLDKLTKEIRKKVEDGIKRTEVLYHLPSSTTTMTSNVDSLEKQLMEIQLEYIWNISMKPFLKCVHHMQASSCVTSPEADENNETPLGDLELDMIVYKGDYPCMKLTYSCPLFIGVDCSNVSYLGTFKMDLANDGVYNLIELANFNLRSNTDDFFPCFNAYEKIYQLKNLLLKEEPTDDKSHFRRNSFLPPFQRVKN
ncbi:hypothetical protein BDA99DRAFT_560181 [Phascolomyces articulosus]|uniref:Uncharacterized protein n=1 Tax=Phascolomyces articulosus TaxID=60185 RepID=A0AAD5K9X3_9FUNG|nr:hypothetical protein BDA99DRAFT_560181 [Phascolomyces articulosus]